MTVTAAPSRSLYLNGKMVPYEQALVHVQCGGMKYGASVFEGLRAYWSDSEKELLVFRLEEHLDRLLGSMRLMRMDHKFTRDELRHSVIQTLRQNGFREDVHIRQSAYVEEDGLIASTGPVGLAVDASARKIGSRTGVHACISSWTRSTDTSVPTRIKCSANYQNGRMAGLEAKANGYDVPLLLNSRGKVSESIAACLFIVRGGVPITPPFSADILESVTRDSVLQLLERKLGITFEVRDIDRTEVALAEEVFICGTLWEITPVLSVDRLPIGDGRTPGRLSAQIGALYEAAARGQDPEFRKWVTPVHAGAAGGSSS